MVANKRKRRKVAEVNPQELESHHRKILVTPADMLGSARLERLAQRLLALQTVSGMTNPEYAEFLGMSGSQFRYVRRRLANPSVHMLAHVAKQTMI
ncbi:MAG: hypothetical protein JOZ26_07070, partial [Hyphomicrobiales bacterium]|nr:hypothetical protein [Hyphomicrobiales bacterium]